MFASGTLRHFGQRSDELNHAINSALLTVLQDATIDLRDLRGEELADRAKYAELVMKVCFPGHREAACPDRRCLQCLWKVSKTVKESLENGQLLAPRLLSDINQFLVTIPPAEWRRRSTDGIPLADMPLRTVKTILQQVVSVLKGQVFEELDEIDQAENSFVYQYLYRLVNQPGADGATSRASSSALARQASVSSLGSNQRDDAPSRASDESSPRSRTSSRSAAPPAVTSPGGTDIAVNQRLKEIFDMIGDPNNSRAVRQLAPLTHSSVLIGISHRASRRCTSSRRSTPKLLLASPPGASRPIHTSAAPAHVLRASRMAGTGSYFQTYLKRALANLEAADRERNAEPPVSPSAESASSRTYPRFSNSQPCC